MRISIITICYNSADTIEDTIKSVIAQNYSDLEYIIIDGGSEDGTLDIVEKYKDKIAKVVSEPDKGIYDAMNKGIGVASGEVVGILNSDDFYHHDTVLLEVAKLFESSKAGAVYGNISYVDRDDKDKEVRFWRAGEYKKFKLNSGWIMPHPAFFVRKSLYQNYGKFNLDFRIAADYELMLRFLLKGINMVYIDKSLVCMREGGFSASGLKQRRLGWMELKNSWEVNGENVPAFFIIRRVLSKLKQYFV